MSSLDPIIIFFILVQLFGLGVVVGFIRLFRNPEAEYQRRKRFYGRWMPWLIPIDEELRGKEYRKKKAIATNIIPFLMCLACYFFATKYLLGELFGF